MQMQKLFAATMAVCLALVQTNAANACSGIMLHAKDKAVVAARTIDWSGEEMDNIYVVVPRGYTQNSLLPDNQTGGVQFTAKYGYVGLAVEQPQFILDGTNEAGLSAGLFYFPRYGEYKPYNPDDKDISLADFQLVSWILSNFATIDEVKAAINDVRIINIDPRAATVHWRIIDKNGRAVVLEIIKGVPHFYENELGVITNSPGFEWHMTNLNNYVNLKPGTVGPTQLGPITLTAFGGNSGMHGIPGDFSPPSRFVRASFFETYSLTPPNGYETVLQAFHILNNFDVPIGTAFPADHITNEMPSATQWTIATDITNRVVYYHTMYNRAIRSIDMKNIDFGTVAFQYHPLDTEKKETIIPAKID